MTGTNDVRSLREPAPLSKAQNGAERWIEAASGIYAALSPKERAVLLAAARGSEDKEIAADLGCTLSTVRTLWQRTYKKTRTASRRRLIAAIWEEACHLASRHFLNDVTSPRDSLNVASTGVLGTRASVDRQSRER
jgi:DNA-binding CsgD family transcriptional regulator